jgi:hypothetical protein
LFAIIQSEWDSFKPILSKDPNYWKLRGDFLSKTRNPYAHLREREVQAHEKMIVEGYCREILAAVGPSTSE